MLAKHRLFTVLFTSAMLLFVVQLAWGADTYTQGQLATLADMTSQTEATTPADRTRTTIGIAEKVTCQIDANTWSDKDCNVTKNTEEDDTTLGILTSRIWSKSGTQAANSSLSTTTGDSTILTASKSPGSVTVTITVPDSAATQFKDPDIVKTKEFTIIAPEDSLTYTKVSDSPTWTAWASGDKYLGARALYTVRLAPATVSFYRASIRENFGTGKTDTWPDGSTWAGPTGTVGPVTPTQANLMGDEQKAGLHNSNKLYDGATWKDFAASFPIPFEYLNAASVWTAFTTATGTDSYTHADRKAVVGVGGKPSSSQGPWQNP